MVHPVGKSAVRVTVNATRREPESRGGRARRKEAPSVVIAEPGPHLCLLELLDDAPGALEDVDAPPFPLAEHERLRLPLVHDLAQAHLYLELLVRALRDLLNVLPAQEVTRGQ